MRVPYILEQNNIYGVYMEHDKIYAQPNANVSEKHFREDDSRLRRGHGLMMND